MQRQQNSSGKINEKPKALEKKNYQTKLTRRQMNKKSEEEEEEDGVI